jgi:peptidoglycan/LPS O-acetylase OafA/YrhL
MGTTERRGTLDVLRAGAALAVVVHHVAFASGHTLNSRVGEITGRLDIGVSIFFVLSGYLLFAPFAAALIDDRGLPSGRGFLVRRATRIFPAYWLALGVLAAIDAVQLRDLGGVIATATLTQVYQPDTALLGIVQAWSLATEIGFYLVLPVAAVGLRRLVRGRTTNQRAMLLIAALVAVAVSTYLFRTVMYAWDTSVSGVSAFWLPSHADTFAAGMIVAVLDHWRRRVPSIDRMVIRWTVRRWPYGVAASLAFLVMATQFELAVGLQSASLNRELARHATYTAVSVLIVAPFALGRARETVSPAVRLGATVGLVSYGVYLWHQVLIAGAFSDRVAPWTLFDGSFWPRLLCTVPLAVALGAVSWFLVEKPVLRLTRRTSRSA